MKIVMLTGSPHEDGATNRLANAFIEGAQESGHEVSRFDIAFLNVGPCLGCDYCVENNMRCRQEDDMGLITEQILQADGLVLASPVHFYSFSAQIKNAIDRLYAIIEGIQHMNMRAGLIVVGGGPEMRIFDEIEGVFVHIADFLRFDIAGKIKVPNVLSADDLLDSPCLELARSFGRHFFGQKAGADPALE